MTANLSPATVEGFKAPSGAVRPWWRDPAVQVRSVDVIAAMVAASLPWSTSATGILMTLWVIALVPTLDWRALLQSFGRPASALPLVFLALAVVGTLWSDSAWSARLHGINPVAKLAAIPLLIYHFERTSRGLWVFAAFVVSCALLMVLSWAVLLAPSLKIVATPSDGVPVKNYIDQSQEFALCMFALAPQAVAFGRERRLALAAGCAALIAAFFANMMFVVSARTALIYMPVLLVLYGLVHLRARAMAALIVAALVCGAVVWSASPYLRERVGAVATEYQAYHDSNAGTSTGERLEYWRKSAKFVADAPAFGNGTGSTKDLFIQDAVGKSGVSAEVIGNPHNQTLNVAVQWGLLGVLVLYAMWVAHGLLFRPAATTLAGWIGLVVVVQNVVSSLLNSHLFDFHEGWMYVLGVGVAGGTVLRRRVAAGARRTSAS